MCSGNRPQLARGSFTGVSLAPSGGKARFFQHNNNVCGRQSRLRKNACRHRRKSRLCFCYEGCNRRSNEPCGRRSLCGGNVFTFEICRQKARSYGNFGNQRTVPQCGSACGCRSSHGNSRHNILRTDACPFRRSYRCGHGNHLQSGNSRT